jgi:hypothetical protein
MQAARSLTDRMVEVLLAGAMAGPKLAAELGVQESSVRSAVHRSPRLWRLPDNRIGLKA